jgi:hypothetical protein
MKFNREHLEELTLQKIKEVNDEAGYRKYLEVPEMVNIIASIMEEKYMQIINDTLRVLPFGNIFTHTPENIPDRVQDLAKALAEECYLREKWEACADMLFVYADEVKCGTHNQALWEAACQDIEKYKQLKNE